jgi:hypothetical protein
MDLQVHLETCMFSVDLTEAVILSIACAANNFESAMSFFLLLHCAGFLQNDLWELNPVTYSWRMLSSGQDNSLETKKPQARAHHGFINLQSLLFLFGGQDQSGCIVISVVVTIILFKVW